MFSFLFKRSVKVSGKVASRRLKQLLMADRVSCPAEITDSIYTDIVSVLSKSFEIDTQNINIALNIKPIKVILFFFIIIILIILCYIFHFNAQKKTAVNSCFYYYIANFNNCIISKK